MFDGFWWRFLVVVVVFSAFGWVLFESDRCAYFCFSVVFGAVLLVVFFGKPFF